MSKIIQAINSMIAKSDKITDVTRSEINSLTYFFLYGGQYKWAINYDPNEEVIYLTYYSTSLEIKTLAKIDDFRGIDMVTYCSRDYSVREAQESFQELLTIVSEKLFGVDKVLEDIIDDPPF